MPAEPAPPAPAPAAAPPATWAVRRYRLGEEPRDTAAVALTPEARVDLERIFGTKVFLDLRVRVEKDWQRKDDTLDRLGF